MRRICWAMVAVTLAAGAVGAQTPPVAVLERLQSAINPEDDAFTGSWRMTTFSVVEKPNGKAHHEATMEMSCSRDARGRLHRQVIRFIKDGTDETKKIRARLEKQEAEGEAGRKKKNGRKKKEQEADVVPPDPEHRDLYVFEPLPPEDGAARCVFRPAPGHAKDRGLLTGELAWDPRTLDPLWIEGELSHPPGPLKEMHLRIELRRNGDLLYTSRMVTGGLARILLLKRRFHADVRFEDVEPAAPAAGD
ncbi:MAG: hypothetical protein GXP47_14290 [Acidobacteria bacterium]|nr:hypothetical protein [Acidobacteriota bacterium]